MIAVPWVTKHGRITLIFEALAVRVLAGCGGISRTVRGWAYKKAKVLKKMPRSAQQIANSHVRKFWMASTRESGTRDVDSSFTSTERIRRLANARRRTETC